VADYYVNILTNRLNTVLYIGITNDLVQRRYEHKHELSKGFTSKYGVDKLVFYEVTSEVLSAIAREKQIKGWRQARKGELVATTNPRWLDLSEGWYDE
jgi:putative endonuclease